ncbi:hypothetical protein TorRG33x02_124620, partial [Trema orientale]
VTCYFHFLSSLIETEQDVRELRTTKVFRTHLKSDVEVVDLFKTIHNNLMIDYNSYQEVSKELLNHYNQRYKSQITEFAREHFSRPWSVLAFIAVLVYLFLSAVQTYCAFHPK